MIGGVVLAAGRGRRFGAVKQLAPLHGRPLLEHALGAMAGSPVDEAVVVLGFAAQRIATEADLCGIRPVLCEGWEAGQAASLRAGVTALPETEAVVVTLGDQPLVSSAAIDRLISSRSDGLDGLRASYGGEPGHPVVLERPLLDRVLELRGDVGARDLLARARVRAVPCDGLGSAEDLDTPEQLEELERSGD